MVDEGCQKGAKRMLMLISLFIMCFGNEGSRTKKCKNVNISNWETVMLFLLINHLIGQPRNMTNKLQIIFGYWNVNIISFLWCIRGIFNLYKIVTKTPGCIIETERSQILIEIVLGFIGSYKFVVSIFATLLVIVLAPLAFLLHITFNYSLYNSACLGFLKFLLYNKILGFNDFEAELRERRVLGPQRVRNQVRQEVEEDGFNYNQIEKLKDKCEIKVKDDDLESDRFKTHDQCSICLDSYKTDDKVIAFKECPHIFHSGCIESWLKINYYCPLCKSDTRKEIGIFEETAVQADLIEEEFQRIEMLPMSIGHWADPTGRDFDVQTFEFNGSETERGLSPSIVFETPLDMPASLFFRENGEFRMRTEERRRVETGIRMLQMLRRIEQLERERFGEDGI